jgi:hypothetical protein
MDIKSFLAHKYSFGHDGGLPPEIVANQPLSLAPKDRDLREEVLELD